MFRALDAAGFTYDASSVSKGPAMPDSADKPARFALPQIPEGPEERRVIAMDYNLFVRHSGGFERTDKDRVFEARTLKAFREAFDTQYQGKRIPLQIGFHFSLMNGAAYWRALERSRRKPAASRRSPASPMANISSARASRRRTPAVEAGRSSGRRLIFRADARRLSLKITLVDVRKRLAVQRRLESPQAFID